MMYLGDYAEDDTVYFLWSTNDSAGASITRATDGTVSVYKDNGTTQSTAGVTGTEDFDSLTGIHECTIDLSADAFYEIGADYAVVLSAATIDGQTVNAVLAHFSIENRYNAVEKIGASSGGGSLNFPVESDNTGGAIKSVTFVGSQTNTYTATEAEDDTNHIIDDTGNAFDIVYQVDVGGGRKAVDAVFKGYLNSGNDNCNIQAYDYVGTDWETLHVLTGQAGSVNNVIDIPLLSKHTGTGSDIGKVLIRFVCTGQSNPQLNVDQLLVEAVSIGQTVGYANGGIWIDTTNGTAGTEDYVNGTADNPVSTIANALTLSSSLGLTRFFNAPNSAITFAASFANKTIDMTNSTLTLGGQALDNAVIANADILSSIGTIADSATPVMILQGTVGSDGVVTLGDFYMSRTGVHSIKMGRAGNYKLIDCVSAIPGASAPTVDLDSNACNVEFRRWSGGLTLNNVVAGSVVSVDCVSGGTVTVNGTGGTVHVRGMVAVTDGSSGAVSITETQVLNRDDMADALWDEAMVEATGVPGVTGSFRNGLEWVYALSRNKMTQTATTSTLRNDADDADIATSTVSDDGTTFTRGEWS